MAKSTNIPYNPASAAAIAAMATSQIETEQAGAIAPLTAEEQRLALQRQRSDQDIGHLYDSLMPYVAASAQRSEATHQQNLLDEKGIFDAAMGKIGEMYGAQAQEAQGLAQSLGAPVSAGLFTRPSTIGGAETAALGAGAQFGALGNLESATDLAETFAGRVFPLMRTREYQTNLNKYTDEVNAIEKQIADIKAGKAGAINKRKRELLLEEREFALQKAQANRDWVIAQGTLKQGQTGLDIQREQIKSNERMQTQQLLSQAQQNQLDRANQRWLKNRDIYASTLGEGAANAKVKNDQRKYAADILDAAASNAPTVIASTASYPVSAQRAAEIQQAGGAQASQLFNLGTDAAPDWVILREVKERIDPPNVKDLNALYRYLIARGIPQSMARNQIRLKFNKPKWVYKRNEKKPPPISRWHR